MCGMEDMDETQRGSRCAEVCGIEQNRITWLQLCPEDLQEQIGADLT